MNAVIAWLILGLSMAAPVHSQIRRKSPGDQDKYSLRLYFSRPANSGRERDNVGSQHGPLMSGPRGGFLHFFFRQRRQQEERHDG